MEIRPYWYADIGSSRNLVSERQLNDNLLPTTCETDMTVEITF